jgi:sugar-specific transcriptional regulator TrmB
MKSDENIQTLVNFGLSYVQAEVYLTLLKLKKSDAKTLAKTSNIARQDIYRTMPTLQRLGLVEKIIGTPTMYRATPVRNAAAILLEGKKQEYDSLVQRTDSLIAVFEPINEKISPSADDTQFVIGSELSPLINRHEKLTRQCQSTLDIIVPLRGVPNDIGDEWNYIRSILEKKKIETRLITHKPESRDSAFVFWEPLLKKSFFHVRYFDKPITFGMHIFDGKQLTLSVDGVRVLPSLWSNNPNILKLATTYFNKVWASLEKENSSKYAKMEPSGANILLE